MKQNDIQFAVVREDPEIFMQDMQDKKVNKVLMIGSGGCSALSYKSVMPHLDITLLDMNPAQLNLVKAKVQAFKDVDNDSNYRTSALFKNAAIKHRFGILDENGQKVGNKEVNTLSSNGNFESLFRQLMSFVFEFVVDKKELKLLLEEKEEEKVIKKSQEIFSNKYWNLAFKLYFSDDILITMFGMDAVQHAEPGSYPAYFQKVFENAILKSNRNENYFLDHILFDEYREKNLPYYLKEIPSNMDFTYILGQFSDIKNIKDFDMIDLSNIFDWMDISEVTKIINVLKNKMKIGSMIIFRQINNYKNITEIFGEEFSFDEDKCQKLKEKSRSMFYNRTNLGIKIK